MVGTQTADVVIAGGGLHGLSAAIHLAKAGMRVVLLEKDRVGRHASSANAGGVRRLGRALPEIPLADEALVQWRRIEELVDDRCGFKESAQIKVAETTAELKALNTRVQTMRNYGYSHEQIIDQSALAALLPDAAQHCVGGLIVRGDGHADPFATVRAFQAKAHILGVQILEGMRVDHIIHRGRTWRIKTDSHIFEAPNLVNAAGAWGGQIAAMMGDFAPLQAQALMLMITERIRPFLTAVVGAQGRALSFKQFDNGTVLIGGAYQGHADIDNGSAELNISRLGPTRAPLPVFSR